MVLIYQMVPQNFIYLQICLYLSIFVRDVKSNKVKISIVIEKIRLAHLNAKALTIPLLKLQLAVTTVRIKSKLLKDANRFKNYFEIHTK